MLNARTAAPTYLVHHQLGAGGMGVVHLGTMVTRVGRRRVAIKSLKTGAADDRWSPDQLLEEARLVFQLTHANICQVIDLGSSADGALFVVMEYVRGLDLRTLSSLLAQANQMLDAASAIYVARELARALDYAHRSSTDDGRPLLLVHGDVSPANVLLSLQGEVKLSDFGLARALGNSGPGSAIVGGTAGYTAPEVATDAADQRSDLFSLGATLFTALTGQLPAPGRALGDALAAARPDIVPELIRIVERATAPRPGDRFLAADEMERRLALVLARHFPEFTPSTLGQTVARYFGAPADEDEAITDTLTSVTRAYRVRPPGAPANNLPELAMLVDTATPPPPFAGTEAMPVRRPMRARRLVLAASGAVLVLAAAVVGWQWPRAEHGDRVAAVPPVDAAIVADAGAPATPPPSDAARPVAPPPPTRVPLRTPARTTERRAVRPATTGGFLSVSSSPWGAVYVDGKIVAEQTPLYRHPLAAGRHGVKVFFTTLGRFSQPHSIAIEPGKEARVVVNR
ncbi:MAG: masK2 [Myxococcales bacterium]|nr:masK2 [Myxococcales bacterium]